MTISLDPVAGGGLGSASCELHTAMAAISGSADLLLGTSPTAVESTIGHLKTLGFPVKGPRAAYYAPGLWETAHEQISRCDIAHLHGLYAYPILAGWAAAKKFQRPIVRHPHGMLEPWSLGRSRFKKRIAHLLFENDAFARASLWRALSLAEADQIRRVTPGAKVVVVPNGIDLRPIEETTAAVERQSTVVFLARLHRKKGLDLLLPVWERLTASFPEWRLAIAGPDEDGSGQMARDYASRTGIKTVDFLGPLSGSAKYKLLKSSSVFVLPSYSEGFSMAILEAMACELPVVCTGACHFPELQAAKAGWECSANFDSLLDALKSALASGEKELRERGTVGRHLVETRYTWEKQAADLLSACSCIG